MTARELGQIGTVIAVFIAKGAVHAWNIIARVVAKMIDNNTRIFGFMAGFALPPLLICIALIINRMLT